MLYGVGDQLVEQTGVSIFPAWQLRSDECQARAIEALAGTPSATVDSRDGN